MLNREDYKKYLEQMAEIERHMIEVYSACASLAQDSLLKDTFLKIVEDEKRHSGLVSSLRDLIV